MPAAKVQPDDLLPVLLVRAGDLPSRALVVGDPGRVEKAATRLRSPRELGRNREYLTVAGSYEGTEVALVSHGVGSAGAAVCFEELCRAGVSRLIRAGTAGGLQPEVLDGHLVVATAAVRSDGYTQQVVPMEYPAVSDGLIAEALFKAASLGENTVHRGIVLTTAHFYPHNLLGSPMRMWQEAGVVAVEMEVAALFVIAQLHGAAAGAILAIDGNPLIERDDTMAGYNPHRQVVHDAVESMIGAALDALVR
jgi:uridine phosphorylase